MRLARHTLVKKEAFSKLLAGRRLATAPVAAHAAAVTASALLDAVALLSAILYASD
jgi:hypothetical protein